MYRILDSLVVIIQDHLHHFVKEDIVELQPLLLWRFNNTFLPLIADCHLLGIILLAGNVAYPNNVADVARLAPRHNTTARVGREK